MSDKHNPLMLGDYLTAVKMVFDEIFEDTVWVVCELQSVSTKAGHYYFELTDKDRQSNCRGVLWRNRASVVSTFEQKTGTRLQGGLKVLLCGRAVFHAQYGFSFQIYDIDPSYTLGALAHDYKQMKQKLQECGLFWQNQRLPMSFDLQDILVVSPQNAAGLGDFQAEANRLQQAGACCFYYHHATFQGNHAPLELRQAISKAHQDFVGEYQKNPDLLVIIRGGGAVGDLAYLNDYELAAMVCECPVPVWVGIGHERDQGILDEVAHTRFDTPSKVIFGIQNHLEKTWRCAYDNFDFIKKHSHQLLSYANLQHNQLITTIQRISQNHLSQQKYQTQSHVLLLEQISKQILQSTKQKNALLLLAHKAVFGHLRQKQQQVLTYLQVIQAHKPSTVLQKGYAIVKKNNKTVTSIGTLKPKDTLVVWLKDGSMTVQVQTIQENTTQNSINPKPS